MQMCRKILTIALSGILTAVLLTAMFFQIGVPGKGSGSSYAGLFSRYHMLVGNTISEAMEGISAGKKHYWISRDALAGPKPDPNCYGQTGDPRTMTLVLEGAKELLEGQKTVFTTETEILPETVVQYYLDDTILAVTWKQEFDRAVYTFSEVKIADPSQFRRFLAGGAFGVNQKFTTTEMAESANAVVASSGDFYMFRNSGIIVYDGIVRRARNGVADTCYVDAEGDLHVTGVWDYMDMDTAQKYVDERDILFSLAFGPVLVQDGEVCTPAEYSLGEINDHYPRAALCQMGPLHYLLATVNSEDGLEAMPTIHTFARRLREIGCPLAYALDGGQTAVIAMNGETVNSVMYGHQRQISDIIYFATAIPAK